MSFFRYVALGLALCSIFFLGHCGKLPPVGLVCTPGSQECGDGLYCTNAGRCQACAGGNCDGTESPVEVAGEVRLEVRLEPPPERVSEPLKEPVSEPQLELTNESSVERRSEPLMEPPADVAREPLSEPSRDSGPRVTEPVPDIAPCINGDIRDCYDGESGTKGIAACKGGKQTCRNGRWSTCEGQVVPKAEVCNGIDDDCNGKSDDAYCTRRLLSSLGTSGIFGVAVDAKGDLLISGLRSNQTLHFVARVTRSQPQLTNVLLARNLSLTKEYAPFDVALSGEPGNFVTVRHNQHTIALYDAKTKKDAIIAGKADASGHADGAANEARFNAPSGIAVDGRGVIYVVESAGHTVRKIVYLTNLPCGAKASYTGYCVTTLAGKPGQPGHADGLASAALFRDPQGIAVGRDGTIYVAEAGNRTIRKLTYFDKGTCAKKPIRNAYCVTTLAGNPTQYSDPTKIPAPADGLGTAARFFRPQKIAVDARGTIFVTDQDDGSPSRDFNAIRRIEANGQVLTVVGRGTKSLSNAADRLAGRVLKFSRQQASRGSLIGLAYDESKDALIAATHDDLYEIVLPGRCTAGRQESCFPFAVGRPGVGLCKAGIRTCNAFGIWGTCTGATGPKETTELSCNGADDNCNGAIDEGLVCARLLLDQLGKDGGAFGMAMDGNDRLFINYNAYKSRSQHALLEVNLAMNPPSVVDLSSQPGLSSFRGFRNLGLAWLAAPGTFVSPVLGRNSVRIFDVGTASISSEFGRATGSTGADGIGGAARFIEPFGVATHKGVIYVVGNKSHALRRIERLNAGQMCHGVNLTKPEYCVTTIVGKYATSGRVYDTTGEQARMSNPRGVAIDSNGDIFVADHVNHLILKVTFVGKGNQCFNITTTNGYCVARYAGMINASKPGEGGYVNGERLKSMFNIPYKLAFDAYDNLYVTDYLNDVIRVIGRDGIVRVFAGRGSSLLPSRPAVSTLPGKDIQFGGLNQRAGPPLFNRFVPVSMAFDAKRNVLYAGGTDRLYEFDLTHCYPFEQKCDGKDEDCDGFVDNLPGITCP